MIYIRVGSQAKLLGRLKVVKERLVGKLFSNRSNEKDSIVNSTAVGLPTISSGRSKVALVLTADKRTRCHLAQLNIPGQLPENYIPAIPG